MSKTIDARIHYSTLIFTQICHVVQIPPGPMSEDHKKTPVRINIQQTILPLDEKWWAR